MFKSLIIMSSLCLSSNVFAVVATSDINVTQQRLEDKATVASYMSGILNSTTKINQTMQAVDNLKKLEGLQKLNGVSQLCRACDMSDLKQLYDYSSSVNKDLCSQFSSAYQNLTGIPNAASSIKDIMKLFSTNPQAAMMSLQQASLGAAQTANSTLGQMQLLQAQAQQRELAKEKMQQQVGLDTAQVIMTTKTGL